MKRRELLSLALLPLVEEPVRRVYSFFNNPLWKPLAFGVFELADHEGHKRIVEVEMRPDEAGVWRGKMPIDLGKDLGTAYPPHGAFVFHGIAAKPKLLRGAALARKLPSMSHDNAAKHPARPALFDGDFPVERNHNTLEQLERQWEKDLAEAHPSVEFEAARREREELSLRAVTSPLGMGYSMYPGRPPDGALSPREQQRQDEFETAARRARGGLPDAGDDGPVAVVGGLPYRLD